MIQNQASIINLNSTNAQFAAVSKGFLSDDLQQVVSTSTNIPQTTSSTSIKSSSNTPNPIVSDNENKIDSVNNLPDTPENYLKLLADQISSNDYDGQQDPIKLLAAQQSKLGLLFQTKALEDKVI